MKIHNVTKGVRYALVALLVVYTAGCGGGMVALKERVTSDISIGLTYYEEGSTITVHIAGSETEYKSALPLPPEYHELAQVVLLALQKELPQANIFLVGEIPTKKGFGDEEVPDFSSIGADMYAELKISGWFVASKMGPIVSDFELSVTSNLIFFEMRESGFPKFLGSMFGYEIGVAKSEKFSPSTDEVSVESLAADLSPDTLTEELRRAIPEGVSNLIAQIKAAQ